MLVEIQRHLPMQVEAVAVLALLAAQLQLVMPELVVLAYNQV